MDHDAVDRLVRGNVVNKLHLGKVILATFLQPEGLGLAWTLP